MDGKKFLVLALGVLAGMYVVSHMDGYQRMRDNFVPSTPGEFNILGDDGVDALAIAGVATIVGIGVSKVA